MFICTLLQLFDAHSVVIFIKSNDVSISVSLSFFLMVDEKTSFLQNENQPS